MRCDRERERERERNERKIMDRIPAIPITAFFLEIVFAGVGVLVEGVITVFDFVMIYRRKKVTTNRCDTRREMMFNNNLYMNIISDKRFRTCRRSRVECRYLIVAFTFDWIDSFPNEQKKNATYDNRNWISVDYVRMSLRSISKFIPMAF